MGRALLPASTTHRKGKTMLVSIDASKSKYNDITPKLRAERLKFADFDCFTLHGTDSFGNKFKVEFHLDIGQEFEMETRLAYNHPDNPKNKPADEELTSD